MKKLVLAVLVVLFGCCLLGVAVAQDEAAPAPVAEEADEPVVIEEDEIIIEDEDFPFIEEEEIDFEEEIPAETDAE